MRSSISTVLFVAAPVASLVVGGLGNSQLYAGRIGAIGPQMLFGGGGKDEGMGGGLNMMETIKKAQQVGVKVKELQEELANTEIEATAAEGGVSVSVSGANVPISVTVSVVGSKCSKGSERCNRSPSISSLTRFASSKSSPATECPGLATASPRRRTQGHRAPYPLSYSVPDSVG